MGIICLYMLLAILAACLCEFVQLIGKVYEGPWSSFISSGDNYRYNYISYIVGLVLFFGILVLLYRVLLKKKLETTELYRGDKIFAVISVIVGCILMFVALIALIFVVLGMTDNIGPEVMFYTTMIGWPVGTMIYLLVRLSMDM